MGAVNQVDHGQNDSHHQEHIADDISRLIGSKELEEHATTAEEKKRKCRGIMTIRPLNKEHGYNPSKWRFKRFYPTLAYGDTFNAKTPLKGAFSRMSNVVLDSIS